MAQYWTLRVTHEAREMGRVFRVDRRPSRYEDADGRRMRTELDAIRTRFPDHA